MEEKTEEVKQAIEKLVSGSGDHACRNNPNGICPVTSAVSKDLIFVKKPQERRCPHHIPFGYGGFCNFVARKELYNKYLI